ncbi:MAG: ATP-binding cassette domain-containing protein [Streptosporangiales bacterium]|nr:ATP-binding cassette domain-containing protein [Streptosporangiales bacterium]
MAGVGLAGVAKRFGSTVALQDVSFRVDDGEFFCLLGPSGAGKTTTLKVVAGLEAPDVGQVHLDGRDVTTVEPTDRQLAMCFESYALYPQLDVFGNMVSPLRSPRYRLSPDEASTKVRDVATMLGIETLLDRSVGQLSNGQRQRVALGRVLVRPASARLLDEPLAHLDAKLRATMRAELKSISARGSTTTLYVTHDYVEALALADRIGVLYHGRILQLGTPQELWQTPANAYVASAFGKPRINLVQGQLTDGGAGPVFASPDRAVEILLPGVAVEAGAELQLGVRPRDLRLHLGAGDVPTGQVRLDGLVYVIEYLGRQAEVTVRVGETTLSVLVPRTLTDGLELDDKVGLVVDPGLAHVFRAGVEGVRVERAAG